MEILIVSKNREIVLSMLRIEYKRYFINKDAFSRENKKEKKPDWLEESPEHEGGEE